MLYRSLTPQVKISVVGIPDSGPGYSPWSETCALVVPASPVVHALVSVTAPVDNTLKNGPDRIEKQRNFLTMKTEIDLMKLSPASRSLVL